MSLSASITALDYFINGFIIVSAFTFGGLFVFELTLSFLDCLEQYSTVSDEFYQQTKALLNPTTEPLVEPELPSLDLMTIRELRSFIRNNNLHHRVHNFTGKSVSNARKSELIQALV
ncbi:hypothetical protein [Myxosarcina sp. GI1]|uniref:hypothetical protein n=1 Tax=Myxosarcina sp. GI1 TaxID=1541065 RepID=UPI0005605B03|nr:hypothetical protein [Myxosarcina sp. GI1]